MKNKKNYLAARIGLFLVDRLSFDGNRKVDARTSKREAKKRRRRKKRRRQSKLWSTSFRSFVRPIRKLVNDVRETRLRDERGQRKRRQQEDETSELDKNFRIEGVSNQQTNFRCEIFCLQSYF